MPLSYRSEKKLIVLLSSAYGDGADRAIARWRARALRFKILVWLILFLNCYFDPRNLGGWDLLFENTNLLIGVGAGMGLGYGAWATAWAKQWPVLSSLIDPAKMAARVRALGIEGAETDGTK